MQRKNGRTVAVQEHSGDQLKPELFLHKRPAGIGESFSFLESGNMLKFPDFGDRLAYGAVQFFWLERF